AADQRHPEAGGGAQPSQPRRLVAALQPSRGRPRRGRDESAQAAADPPRVRDRQDVRAGAGIAQRAALAGHRAGGPSRAGGVVGALRAVTAAEIERAIREAAGPLLRSLTLFDVFTFDDGPRSLAWRLTFQADDRTLTDDEVNAIQERVARRIEERFNITWRGA